MRAPWISNRSALIKRVLVDAVACIIAYNSVWSYVYSYSPWGSSGQVQLTVLWLSCSYLVGRYPSHAEKECRETNGQKALGALIAIALCTGAVAAHTWIFGSTDIPTRLKGFVIPLLFLIGGISLVYDLLVDAKKKKFPNNLYMVCTNQERNEVEEMSSEGFFSGSIISFIDHEEITDEIVAEIAKYRSGLILSNKMMLPNHLIRKLVDIRLHGGYILGIVEWFEEYSQIVPSILLDEQWFLSSEGFKCRPGTSGWRIKRYFDIVVASLLLIATTPIVLIAAILIFLEDRGPVLYKQVREGLHGEKIMVYKLRSMRIDAEKHGAQWSKHKDQRITSVGRFLRVLRIDEIPQLVAVVGGELTLVGPRPERPEMNEILEIQIPHYRMREWCKPGLTGWAQVSYPYGASIRDSKRKLGYDIYYMRNSNIILDLVIAIKTAKMVLARQGAIAKTDRD